MSGETEQSVSGWTVDTLHSHISTMLEEIDRRYDSRFTAEEDARNGSDKRYEQRFIAQEGAVQAALVAQEKAVNAALIAADRAVVKAEFAAEKRFDAVNEFRGTLADQAAQLMPRAEAEARLLSMGEKYDTLATRYERSDGSATGISARAAQINTYLMSGLAILVSLGVGIALILHK